MHQQQKRLYWNSLCISLSSSFPISHVSSQRQTGPYSRPIYHNIPLISSIYQLSSSQLFYITLKKLNILLIKTISSPFIAITLSNPPNQFSPHEQYSRSCFEQNSFFCNLINQSYPQGTQPKIPHYYYLCDCWQRLKLSRPSTLYTLIQLSTADWPHLNLRYPSAIVSRYP